MSHDHSFEELHAAAHTLSARVSQLIEELDTERYHSKLARQALLQLLPNEGDGVTIKLDQPMEYVDGSNITSIMIFRSGEILDIRPA
jgi:hypothetical protein